MLQYIEDASAAAVGRLALRTAVRRSLHSRLMKMYYIYTYMEVETRASSVMTITIIMCFIICHTPISSQPTHVVGIHTRKNPLVEKIGGLPRLGELHPPNVGVDSGRTSESPDSRLNKQEM